MPEQPGLEARLERLEQALTRVEERVGVLERGVSGEPVGTVLAPDLGFPRGERARPGDVASTLSLVGRTFVIVAGAYLLRALTESDAFDPLTGAALGVLYAATWIVLAYRVAARRPLSATFFGASAVLIGFPLIWEMTTRFRLLTPGAGALALTVIVAGVLVTSWRQNLRVLAWVTTVAACAMATALIVATGAAVPFTLFLIVLGVGTLWLGYDREWTMMRWFVAGFANLATLALVGRALATPPRDTPALVMTVQFALLIGYFGSIVVRTLLRRRDVLPFEAVQTAALLIVSLGGAIVVASRTGAGLGLLGPALIALAMVCYVVAFVDRWKTHAANRLFYSSIALVLMLAGATLAFNRTGQGLAWMALAVMAAFGAHRSGRITLAAHAVTYVIAADLVSGLASTTFAGLFAAVHTSWAPVSWTSLGALAAIALCAGLLTRSDTDTSARATQALRLALALMIVISAAGVLMVLMRSVLGPLMPDSDASGVIATMRTGVFATMALVAAWMGRRLPTREFGTLLYPLLAWGAVKLMVEDFRTSPPLLLVVAFVVYGGALIFGPRIARTPAS